MGEERVLKVAASTDRLYEVQGFVNAMLEADGCPPATQKLIEVSLEELFVNIAHYAYPEGNGWAEIHASVGDGTAVITLVDAGIPYDQLKRPDPDVTLTAEERQIGGLGIYMVKKEMDDVRYERRDGKNILTIRKNCSEKHRAKNGLCLGWHRPFFHFFNASAPQAAPPPPRAASADPRHSPECSRIRSRAAYPAAIAPRRLRRSRRSPSDGRSK